MTTLKINWIPIQTPPSDDAREQIINDLNCYLLFWDSDADDASTRYIGIRYGDKWEESISKFKRSVTHYSLDKIQGPE